MRITNLSDGKISSVPIESVDDALTKFTFSSLFVQNLLMCPLFTFKTSFKFKITLFSMIHFPTIRTFLIVI